MLDESANVAFVPAKLEIIGRSPDELIDAEHYRDGLVIQCFD